MIAHDYRVDYNAIKDAIKFPEEEPTKKKNNAAVVQRKQPFLHNGMTAYRIDANDPLVTIHKRRYAHGAYIVFPRIRNPNNMDAAMASIHRKKEMYIVDICEKSCQAEDDDDDAQGPTSINTSTNVFTADHFSFVVNPGAPSASRLRFHRTEYVPVTAETGRSLRIDSPLPLEFPLDSLQSRLSQEMLTRYKRWVCDIFKRLSDPNNDDDHHHPASSSIGGGLSSRSRHLHRPLSIKSFDELWYRLPIARMLVFAVPTPTLSTDDVPTHDVTVFVQSRASPPKGIMQHARCFRMASSSVIHRVKLEAKIAKAFSGVQWSEMSRTKALTIDG